MDINKTIEGAKLTVALTGKLDTLTSPELDKSLNESIDGIKELVLDFASLKYISSAGLRVLLAFQKRMNKQGSMCIINVSEQIMEVFEMTGFADILTVE